MRKLRLAREAGVTRRFVCLSALAVLVLAVTSSTSAAVGTTFTVDSTVCSASDCSLRDAIVAANANPGKDTIEFNLPAGPIEPEFELPVITDPVVIDGTTQPGFVDKPIVELKGDALAAGSRGIRIGADAGGTTVRGLVVNGFSDQIVVGVVGVERQAGDGVRIVGNYLGTDLTGTIAAGGNANGIHIIGGSDHVIGGPDPADRNVISGNGFSGIGLNGSGKVTIQGNFIGTNASGDAAVTGLPPSPGISTGIFSSGPGLVLIGGAGPGEGNVISGAVEGGGIVLRGGSRHRIVGNKIGTDVDGENAVPNANGIDSDVEAGVEIIDNVISGNRGAGVRLGGFDVGSVVQGNKIGVDVDGLERLPNADGIHLVGARGVLVGGTTPALRNIISANGHASGGFGSGIHFFNQASRNTIEGNFIGVGADGGNLGNMGTGIFCCGTITSPPGNVVGGTAEGAGNVIAFNGAKGILVLGNRLSFTGPRVSILGNSIYANELLGIDLSTDGPTPNDPTDSDDGPNDFQNFPVIGTITSGGGQTVATTAFSSTPDTEFRLEFFRSTSCNNKPPPSFSWFFGQGQTLVGTRKVMTDSAGNWSDQVTLAGETTPTEVITATATRFTEPGQTLAGSTSEFSECLADLAITKKDEPDPVAAGGSLTYTIDLTNDGPAPATSVRVIDTLPPSVTVTSITPSQGSCSQSGSTVTCELDPIVRDGTARVTIVLNPGTAVRTITNTARVTSEPRDPDASDNSATATTQVVTGGSLVVHKVTVPSPDASDTSFAFTAGGGLSPASFSLKNGELQTFANIPAKAGYSVAENTPAGWDTASTCSDGSPVSNIDVGPGETVTCTFTNTKRGTLVVRKVTVPSPDASDTSFAFAAGGGLTPASFNLKNGESHTFADVAPKAGYSVAETTPAGWDTAGTCSDGSPISNIDVGSGEIVTCTFTNTKRGLARVVKTVRGSPPSGSQSFCFDLRTGASATSAGTVLESQCATAGNGGLINFSTTLVPSAAYALCEIVLPGWMTTLGPPFYVVYNPSGDNSTVCTDFRVDPGQTRTFAVDNIPPPGGLARTIGFWKNWASCAASKGKQKPVLDQTLAAADPVGIAMGTLTLHAGDCLKAVRLLDKSTVDTDKKMASDPAFGLAAQLLAARLNIVAGAGSCAAAVSAINDAQTLLASIHFNGITHDKLSAAQATQANSLATTLDRYNNDLLC